jgi:hypothetical protein
MLFHSTAFEHEWNAARATQTMIQASQQSAPRTKFDVPA